MRQEIRVTLFIYIPQRESCLYSSALPGCCLHFALRGIFALSNAIHVRTSNKEPKRDIYIRKYATKNHAPRVLRFVFSTVYRQHLRDATGRDQKSRIRRNKDRSIGVSGSRQLPVVEDNLENRAHFAEILFELLKSKYSNDNNTMSLDRKRLK